MIKHKYFTGDTLVEVMFAIGLFSVIAVGTVALMNSGTSKVQNSLEITMTRNEIDAEAEALRYVQASYIAERDLSDNSQTYSTLWNDIKTLAINNESITDAELNEAMEFSPSTCAELYDVDGQAMKYGFILNYHMLNQSDILEYKSNKNNGVLFTGKNNSTVFRTTQTYPRILFNNNDSIYTGTNVNPNLTAAEGIYVVAIKDTGITTSVGSGGTASAFIDFYIRSCWQGPSSGAPTLTSTVIRLYDPDIEVVSYDMTTFELIYDSNGGSPTPDTQSAQEKASSYTFNISDTIPVRDGKEAMGWAEQSWGEGNACNSIYAPESLSDKNNTYSVSAANPIVKLKAVYQCPYIALFYSDGSLFNEVNTGPTDQNPYRFNLSEQLKPTKADYTFLGWSTESDAREPDCYVSETCFSQELYAPHDTITTLYAVWHPNYIINYSANGGSYPPDSTVCSSETSPKNCTITTDVPTHSGYEFRGWSTSPDSLNVDYNPGDTIEMSIDNPVATLYAVWRDHNETITIRLTWGAAPLDLDSHVYGQKSDGSYFHAYFSNKIGSDISGLIIAELDRDVQFGFGPETFTINTLGGRNYYYYVHNWTSNSTITGATVTVTSPSLGTITYESKNSSGYGRYWNVFAYKDGRIVSRETHSSNPQTSY